MSAIEICAVCRSSAGTSASKRDLRPVSQFCDVHADERAPNYLAVIPAAMTADARLGDVHAGDVREPVVGGERDERERAVGARGYRRRAASAFQAHVRRGGRANLGQRSKLEATQMLGDFV